MHALNAGETFRRILMTKDIQSMRANDAGFEEKKGRKWKEPRRGP